MSEPYIVFDANCVLCSGMVAFVLRYEVDPTLNFVGAWSDAGLALAAQYHFSRGDLDKTFLVIKDGMALAKSDAGIEILRHLKAPWNWLVLLRYIPRSVRNAVYSFVARHRYRWFGQRQNCMIVPVAQMHRFRGV